MELDINKKFVKAKRPCADGFRWFIKHYSQGGDYQELLDALVADGRYGDACWLLDQFGPTHAVRVVEQLDAEAVVFAGTLKVLGDVSVDQLLRVGGQLHVEAGARIGHQAEDGTQAGLFTGDQARIGGGLHVRGEIRVAGDLRVGWGVLAEGPVTCAGDLLAGWELEYTDRLEVHGNLKPGQSLIVQDELVCAKSIQVQGPIDVAGQIEVRHGLIADGDIRCGLHLEAGWGVRALGDIAVQASLRAGEGVCAGGRIQTGEGYGIYAGLSVHGESWETAAQVSAVERPERLMSGYWVGDRSAQGN